MVCVRGRGQLQWAFRADEDSCEEGAYKARISRKGKEPGGILGIAESHGDPCPHEVRAFSEEMPRVNSFTGV